MRFGAPPASGRCRRLSPRLKSATATAVRTPDVGCGGRAALPELEPGGVAGQRPEVMEITFMPWKSVLLADRRVSCPTGLHDRVNPVRQRDIQRGGNAKNNDGENAMRSPVRIAGASAFLSDSRLAMPQLLRSGEPIDYIVFDMLAESTMANLGRAALGGGAETGFATDFVDGQILPFLAELLDRKIRIIANAGGLDPSGCAAALRAGAAKLGLAPVSVSSKATICAGVSTTS